VFEAETVLLRAYADLDHGRDRAAALQVRAAIHLLEIELAEHEATAVSRLELDELAATADAVVTRVSQTGGDPRAAEELEELIARLERGVERWRFAGAESR
jgi:organic radical activating enzyme